jgi:proline iminopeptidase
MHFHSCSDTVVIFHFCREEYIAQIPEQERSDMVLAYHAQLNSIDDETRIAAAKAWSKWE